MLTVNILKVQRKIVEYLYNWTEYFHLRKLRKYFSFRVSVREMTREITIIFAR